MPRFRRSKPGAAALAACIFCLAGQPRGALADDAVALPPPPAYGTPASEMRLPNLPALGTPYDAAPATQQAVQAAPHPADLAAPAAAEPAPARKSGRAAEKSTEPVAAITLDTPAAITLRKLKKRTGLSDLQNARLQNALVRLASGDEAGALQMAQTLTAELDGEVRIHTVAAGENLFSIAGQEGVYSNSNLWPLLWWNNQPALYRPWQLALGMKLKVPAHPTVEEAAFALGYSRAHEVLTSPAADRDLPARTSAAP